MADIQFFGPSSGNFTATIRDNNGSPSTVLEASQPFSVDTTWILDPTTASYLGGQWEVAVYAESIGNAPEGQFGPTRIVPVTGGAVYSTTVTVPANTVPNNPNEPRSGVYKLVAVLLLRNVAGKVTDIAAVAECPIVRIA
jgi:hypothetical protein